MLGVAKVSEPYKMRLIWSSVVVIMCIVAAAAELEASSSSRVASKKKNSLKRTLLNTQHVVFLKEAI